MNTLQIEKVLSRDPRTRSFFRGCFPADRIPHCEFYPYCMVVNTDPSHLEGSHWTAIFVPREDTIEYYDSFGMKPNAHISDYLKRFSQVLMNPASIQSPLSSACGRHAIYFLVRRCTGIRFEAIIQDLLTSKTTPDKRVNAFFYHMHQSI